MRVLDLGTGVGLVPVAAALAGHLAVGLDFNPCMLGKASENVILNNVRQRVQVLNFDMCEGPEAFKRRFSGLQEGLQGSAPGWFDTFVSTLTLGATVPVTDCVLELVAGLGADSLTLLQVNWPGYRDKRLAMVKERASRVGIVHVASVPMALLGWLGPVEEAPDYKLDIYRRQGAGKDEEHGT